MMCVQTNGGITSGVVGVADEDTIINVYRRGSSSPASFAGTSNGGNAIPHSGDVVKTNVWAGLIFDNVSPPLYEFDDHISYRIKLNGSDVPDTSLDGPSQIEIESGVDINRGIAYFNNGFLALQYAVDTCILQLRTTQASSSSPTANVAMPPFILSPIPPVYRPFPRPATVSDIFHQYSVGLGSLYLVHGITQSRWSDALVVIDS
jgi:hypothetical protein